MSRKHQTWQLGRQCGKLRCRWLSRAKNRALFALPVHVQSCSSLFLHHLAQASWYNLVSRFRISSGSFCYESIIVVFHSACLHLFRDGSARWEHGRRRKRQCGSSSLYTNYSDTMQTTCVTVKANALNCVKETRKGDPCHPAGRLCYVTSIPVNDAGFPTKKERQYKSCFPLHHWTFSCHYKVGSGIVVVKSWFKEDSPVAECKSGNSPLQQA